MRLAIITKSATTKSGARVPFELAQTLKDKYDVTLLAQSKAEDKNLRNKFKNLKLYKTPFDLYRLLKSGSFDVISFHATLAEMLASKLANVPIVATYYGTQFDAYLENYAPDEKISAFTQTINSLLNLLIWTIKKLQMSFADKVISISRYTQKELKELYGINSTVIYLGTNLKPKAKDQKPKTGKEIIILTVSRITPYKGFHKLIDVLNNLRSQGLNLKLILVGSAPKKNYLNYLKRKFSNEDQILTNIDDHALAKLYQSCDIYATCDRYLFFGLPIAEAAGFAKPSICMDFAAASEVVEHQKTGYVAKNQEELERYIQKLALNKSLRQILGQNAKKLADSKFNWQKIAEDYYKVLKSGQHVAQ